MERRDWGWRQTSKILSILNFLKVIFFRNPYVSHHIISLYRWSFEVGEYYDSEKENICAEIWKLGLYNFIAQSRILQNLMILFSRHYSALALCHRVDIVLLSYDRVNYPFWETEQGTRSAATSKKVQKIEF